MNPLPGDVLLTPGDAHFDKHDPQAWDLMLKVARAFRVNTCVLIGDTFDSIGVSRHGRPARSFRFGRGTIKAEAEAAQPYFETIEAIVGANRRPGDSGGLYCLTGNHEHWWRAVQDDVPGLLDHPWFELYGDLFDGWHVFKEYTALKFGPLLICHGHRLRGGLSKYSAASVLGNYPGQNTLYGHTHRVDSCITPTYKYGLTVDHGAWTIGHTRDIVLELKEPALGPHAERHKQGFALTHFFEVAGELRFKVDVVTIDRGPESQPYCVVGGVLFE
jgi:hypothetical protein